MIQRTRGKEEGKRARKEVEGKGVNWKLTVIKRKRKSESIKPSSLQEKT